MMAAASLPPLCFLQVVCKQYSSAQRSLYMLWGAVIVFSFSIVTQVTPFNFEIFSKMGVVLALFGLLFHHYL
jgi:hypothetical protein